MLTINPVRTWVSEHLRPRLDINPGRGGRITFQMSQFPDFDRSGLAIDVVADGEFLPRPHAGQDRSHIGRSEEHTSELQSLMRISYAVFCLKKKINTNEQSHRFISLVP